MTAHHSQPAERPATTASRGASASRRGRSLRASSRIGSSTDSVGNSRTHLRRLTSPAIRRGQVVLHSICHGRRRRPLEPLKPSATLVRAAGWAVVSLGWFLGCGAWAVIGLTNSPAGEHLATASLTALAIGLFIIGLGGVLRATELNSATNAP